MLQFGIREIVKCMIGFDNQSLGKSDRKGFKCEIFYFSNKVNQVNDKRIIRMPVENAYFAGICCERSRYLNFNMANRVNYKANFLFLLLHVVNILLQLLQDIAEKQIFFRR